MKYSVVADEQTQTRTGRDAELSDRESDRLLMEVVRSAEDLRQRVEIHRQLLVRLCGGGASVSVDLESANEAILKAAVAETIDVLESTRRSFKSKQLEVLRKRLTRVLVALD
jgi:aromatic ring hydroxylase